MWVWLAAREISLLYATGSKVRHFVHLGHAMVASQEPEHGNTRAVPPAPHPLQPSPQNCRLGSTVVDLKPTFDFPPPSPARTGASDSAPAETLGMAHAWRGHMTAGRVCACGRQRVKFTSDLITLSRAENHLSLRLVSETAAALEQSAIH